MRSVMRLSVLVAALACVTLPLGAQTREGMMGDLLRDVTEVETKVLGLARAIPATAYDWRPGKGVRSTGEVGRIRVVKTESKGKGNKRIRLEVLDA